jgi:hypothetical protein
MKSGEKRASAYMTLPMRRCTGRMRSLSPTRSIISSMSVVRQDLLAAFVLLTEH